jgi:hypothetical protein
VNDRPSIDGESRRVACFAQNDISIDKSQKFDTIQSGIIASGNTMQMAGFDG